MLKKIWNSKGFTLAEMMVAAGLMGVTMLFAAKFFANIQKKNKEVGEDVVKTLGLLHFEKIIDYDISHSRYSLSALDVPDDEGRNFFDHFFDVPCDEDCKREFTLEGGGGVDSFGKSFYLIISDKTYQKDVLFSPKNAYDDSALFFNSLNYKGFLGARSFTPWRKNRLMYMYSQMPVRKEGVDPGKVPPSIISYLGWIEDLSQSARLLQETIDDKGTSFFQNKDPRDGARITNEDLMLRRVPYIHGLSNDVYLTNVKIIRYRIKTEKVGRSIIGKLYRGVKNIGGDFKERMVAEGVKFLKFKRPNISDGEIAVELDMIK